MLQHFFDSPLALIGLICVVGAATLAFNKINAGLANKQGDATDETDYPVVIKGSNPNCVIGDPRCDCISQALARTKAALEEQNSLVSVSAAPSGFISVAANNEPVSAANVETVEAATGDDHANDVARLTDEGNPHDPTPEAEAEPAPPAPEQQPAA